MTFGELLASIIGLLERCGIPYMVTGSLASSYHGEPRATRDADMAFRLDSDLIATLVLSRAQLRAVVDGKPKGFGDHPEMYHSDAIFLIGIEAATALEVFDPHPAVDRVWPGDGVIYSQRLSAERTRSRLNKAISTPLYKSMTIRSWATTMALHEMLEDRPGRRER